jgi:hypothetical protein
MDSYTQRFEDWMNPDKKFRFISINSFAQYLGIKQTAVHDLVNSKRIDSVVIDGSTLIPFSFRLSAFSGYDPDQREGSSGETPTSTSDEGFKRWY